HLMEQEIFGLLQSGIAPQPAHLDVDASMDRQYLDYLLSAVTQRFDGMRLIVDCGNGASYRLAPELFRRLGADVTAIGADPDGRNINLDCGAMHVQGLQGAVRAG